MKVPRATLTWYAFTPIDRLPIVPNLGGLTVSEIKFMHRSRPEIPKEARDWPAESRMGIEITFGKPVVPGGRSAPEVVLQGLDDRLPTVFRRMQVVQSALPREGWRMFIALYSPLHPELDKNILDLFARVKGAMQITEMFHPPFVSPFTSVFYEGEWMTYGEYMVRRTGKYCV